MYKSLNDVKRVIALNKPQRVIDIFSESYLTGVAMQPYLDAEKEYAELVGTIDRDPKPEVLADDGVTVLESAVGYNAIRDARIAELVLEHPYLIAPLPEQGTRIEVDLETQEETAVIYDLPIPSIEERRPVPETNPALITNIMREYSKRLRDAAVKEAVVTISTGKTFDADETSQSRISRALQAAQIIGQTETDWVMADNTVQRVTVEEMAEALALSIQKQAELWFVGN